MSKLVSGKKSRSSRGRDLEENRPTTNFRRSYLIWTQSARKRQFPVTFFTRRYLHLDVSCRLRTWPAATNTERMAVDDDVIPLQFPVQTSDGKTISSIKVKKGQVRDLPSTVCAQVTECLFPRTSSSPRRLSIVTRLSGVKTAKSLSQNDGSNQIASRHRI